MRIARDQVCNSKLEQPECALLAVAAESSVDRSGRELHDGPVLRQTPQPLWGGLDLRVALGMRQDDGEAVPAQLEYSSLQVEWPAEVGELEKEILRVAGEPEAGELVSFQDREPIERDLAAGENFECYSFKCERFADLREALFHFDRARRIVLTYVWRGGHNANPIGHGRPRHRDALLQGPGAVVEPWKDVRVQVDHAAHPIPGCRFPWTYLRDRCSRTKRRSRPQ